MPERLVNCQKNAHSPSAAVSGLPFDPSILTVETSTESTTGFLEEEEGILLTRRRRLLTGSPSFAARTQSPLHIHTIARSCGLLRVNIRI